MDEQEKEGKNNKIGKVEPKHSAGASVGGEAHGEEVPSNVPRHVPDKLDDLDCGDVFLPPIYMLTPSGLINRLKVRRKGGGGGEGAEKEQNRSGKGYRISLGVIIETAAGIPCRLLVLYLLALGMRDGEEAKRNKVNGEVEGIGDV